MSSTLPQNSYFDNDFRIPTSPEWSICGHSRALERTGFVLSGLGFTILLDAGIDVPESVGIADLILVTHTHIDHSNAIPMLLRHERPGRLTHIFAPAKVLNRLREYAQLSFSMKVDYDQEVPQRYCTPPRIFNDDGQPVYETWEAKTRRWHPVAAGLTLPVGLGKGGKQVLVIQTVLLYHNRCSTVGYIISERKSKLKPHLEGVDKKETAGNVMLAKSRGESISDVLDKPVLAFICDTSIKALTSDGLHADLILSVPVMMVECTYLESAMEEEATRRGHICWSQLRPIVLNKFNTLSDNPFTVILIHFSLRYTDADIVTFFMTPATSGVGDIVLRKTDGVITFDARSVTVTTADTANSTTVDNTDITHTIPVVSEDALISCGGGGTLNTRNNIGCGPSQLVLWLDSGVEEIWLSSAYSTSP